jgi:8-oxo-dGTP diphosphatase
MMDVSVDCVVFGFDEKKLKVLLIEQKHAGSDKKLPRKQTALPGDLVKEQESLDQCAKRVSQTVPHFWRPQTS